MRMREKKFYIVSIAAAIEEKNILEKILETTDLKKEKHKGEYWTITRRHALLTQHIDKHMNELIIHCKAGDKRGKRKSKERYRTSLKVTDSVNVFNGSWIGSGGNPFW